MTDTEKLPSAFFATLSFRFRRAGAEKPASEIVTSQFFVRTVLPSGVLRVNERVVSPVFTGYNTVFDALNILSSRFIAKSDIAISVSSYFSKARRIYSLPFIRVAPSRGVNPLWEDSLIFISQSDKKDGSLP